MRAVTSGEAPSPPAGLQTRTCARAPCGWGDSKGQRGAAAESLPTTPCARTGCLGPWGGEEGPVPKSARLDNFPTTTFFFFFFSF